jgi:hypothetical protein
LQLRSKILGLLLSAALVMASLATGAWADINHANTAASSTGRSEAPAACHAHGGMALPDSQLPHSHLPAPANYQCCLTGHDAAVVQASHFVQPSAQSMRATLPVKFPLTGRLLGGFGAFIVHSADPPGITLLRI